MLQIEFTIFSINVKQGPSQCGKHTRCILYIVISLLVFVYMYNNYQ